MIRRNTGNSSSEINPLNLICGIKFNMQLCTTQIEFKRFISQIFYRLNTQMIILLIEKRLRLREVI